MTYPTRLRAAAELERRRRAAARVTAAVEVPLPAWARELERPARYKVAWGGRGSGKSWTFASLIVRAAAARPMRVLCARELQISIKDSVHRLLADRIAALGLSGQYQVGESFIRSHAGSEFIFKGLRHNADEIKSMERISICWVEEAHSVSEASWRLLIPTIRAPGSEIWVTFNPDHETDPVYQRFVVAPPPGAIVRRVNYDENPYFPPELEAERAWMQRTDPDGYAHVWLGGFNEKSDTQVLAGKWVAEPFEPDAGWDGPYYGADWGFASDPTALVRCWLAGRTLYVEHEEYGVGIEIDQVPARLDRIPGSRQHLIRADSARPETISYVARQGFRIVGADKWQGSVEDGVAFLRSLERIVIHPRCRHAAEEARLWRYKTDRLSGDVLPALAPGHEHVWDAVRYALAPVIRARASAFWLPPAEGDAGPGPPGLPAHVRRALAEGRAERATCGACQACAAGRCAERGVLVGADDPACGLYLARS